MKRIYLIILIVGITCNSCHLHNAVTNKEIQPTTTIADGDHDSGLTSPEIHETGEPLEQQSIPEGLLLYTTLIDNGLWLLNTKSMAQYGLYNFEDDFIFSPMFFPDGERIAFLSGFERTDGRTNLYQGNIYGNDSEMLINSVDSFDISPNGDFIAYVQEATEGNKGEFDLYLFEMETNRTTRLTNDADYIYNVLWSFDGQKIAYLRNNPNANADLVIIDFQSSAPTILISEDVLLSSGLQWSLDSQRIVTQLLLEDTIVTILVDTNSGEIVRVPTPDSNCSHFNFLSNADQLICDCYLSGSLNFYLLNMENGSFNQVSIEASNSLVDGVYVGNIKYLSDNFVLISYWDGHQNNPGFDLFYFNLDTDRISRIIEGVNIDSFDFYSQENDD